MLNIISRKGVVYNGNSGEYNRVAIPCTLCSIAANLMVNYASAKMSVFQVSSFGALSTLTSTLAGVLVLGEPWSWALLLGGGLILVGVRQVTRPK
ncbi:MAG: EamA family transporter [Oscillospiraceae bacterium]|nr:EamA family transporter [Oscillospiraceae bacterium]